MTRIVISRAFFHETVQLRAGDIPREGRMVMKSVLLVLGNFVLRFGRFCFNLVRRRLALFEYSKLFEALL